MRQRGAQGGLRWRFRVSEQRDGGVLILVASGRLSHASAPDLEAILQAAVSREQGGLVLDFGQLDYISSAGLLTIQDAAARLAQSKGVLVLCAVPEPVRIAFDLAGFLSDFIIEPSRERAVARIAART